MAPNQVPLFDAAAQTREVELEMAAVVQRVLRSGRYILGNEVEAFENEVAQCLGVRHAVGVASGTDALLLSLIALGIGAGDEVVTTPYTFIATAAAIGPRTRAILPPAAWGTPVVSRSSPARIWARPGMAAWL